MLKVAGFIGAFVNRLLAEIKPLLPGRSEV